MIERSAEGCTVVVCVAELFALLASGVLLETDAVFEITVLPVMPESTFTVKVKLAVVKPRLVAAQLIEPVAPTDGVVQLQPPGAERDWKVVFVGTVSDKINAVAVAGPLFVTTIV